MMGGARSRPRSRRIALVVAVLAAAALIGAAPSAATPAPDTAAPNAIGIDTTSLAAVNAAWATITAAAPASGFTGNVAGCVPGTTSQAYRTAELSTLNAIRSLSGVPALTEDQALSTQVQKTALMMAKANDLSHSPGTTWPC